MGHADIVVQNIDAAEDLAGPRNRG